jgi:syntaxin 7
MRRSQDPYYQDDPEFSKFAEELSVKLFSLTSNIARLSSQINLLGTKRDTERVRERVHDLLVEARDGFKDVGEGIKKLTGWEDLNVCIRFINPQQWLITALGVTKVYTTEAIARIPSLGDGISNDPAHGARKAASIRFSNKSGHRFR